jgi:hypothetical protein
MHFESAKLKKMRKTEKTAQNGKQKRKTKKRAQTGKKRRKTEKQAAAVLPRGTHQPWLVSQQHAVSCRARA